MQSVLDRVEHVAFAVKDRVAHAHKLGRLRVQRGRRGVDRRAQAFDQKADLAPRLLDLAREEEAGGAHDVNVAVLGKGVPREETVQVDARGPGGGLRSGGGRMRTSDIRVVRMNGGIE